MRAVCCRWPRRRTTSVCTTGRWPFYSAGTAGRVNSVRRRERGGCSTPAPTRRLRLFSGTRLRCYVVSMRETPSWERNSLPRPSYPDLNSLHQLVDEVSPADVAIPHPSLFGILFESFIVLHPLHILDMCRGCRHPSAPPAHVRRGPTPPSFAPRSGSSPDMYSKFRPPTGTRWMFSPGPNTTFAPFFRNSTPVPCGEYGWSRCEGNETRYAKAPRSQLIAPAR